MSAVRIATGADADEVGRILADGFCADPVMSWVFDEPGRAEKLRVVFGFLAAEALVPLGGTFLTDGACASWTPPGSPAWPAERGERMLARMETCCSAAEIDRLGTVDAAQEANHPAGDHWYLGSIATEPAAQGRGRGTALLEASLARVDGDGLGAYLESTNPRNVSLYERHGFRVTGTIELPGGPSLTPMWRDPGGR